MAQRNLGKQFDRRSDLAKAMDGHGPLPMFATGGELMQHVTPLEDDREWHDVVGTYDEEPETDEEFWDRKTEEADHYGLTDSVDHAGVQRPVRITEETGTVMNGHHRIAAAVEVENRRYGTSRQGPSWVPISWDEEHAMPGSGHTDMPAKYDRMGLPHQRGDY